ncbi:MAG: U32 family peptidase [Clostridia bacterium]|nr:U32 family peptidase [Clostridia bacterium]
MNNIEILAPAGGVDSLSAAVRCGADAVYLGSQLLNARRNATNFSFDELRDAVSYCHTRNVKVYIVLNTIVSDDEFNNALSVIECGCAIGADAFIIQDLGVARLVKSAAPSIPIFASTQMSVQTSFGVDLLHSIGFSRAILPREMSISEIKAICKSSPIELEVFVHGALCMSVSGQCYMSAMLGGRSGNRGLCAQPCRLPFGVEGGTGFDLSLKDLSIIEDIPRLVKAGITSFKIEGRMKRPEYVAAAVTACKQSLSGKIDESLKNDLRAVFSRSGFTRGYLEANLGKDMFGTRQKEDITSTPAALSSLASLYRHDIQKVAIDFAFNANIDEPISLSASCCGIQIFEQSDVSAQAAQNRATDENSINVQLQKCGGTPFFANDIFIDIDDNVFVPVSAINSLRRVVLEQLEQRISKIVPKEFTKISLDFGTHKSTSMDTFLRFANAEQIPQNLGNACGIIVPLSTPKSNLEKLCKGKIPVGVEIPRGIFGTQDNIKKALESAKECGVSFAYCGTLDAVAIAKDVGIKIMGGSSLNIYNSASLQMVEELGANSCVLSPEITLKKASTLGVNIQRGLITYGRLPLMLTRNCPANNARDCSQCDHNAVLTDRLGVQFPIVCTNGFSEILNSRPIYMAERLKELDNIDFMILFFTKESADECEKIIDAYQTNKSFDNELTRGLYYRGVE